MTYVPQFPDLADSGPDPSALDNTIDTIQVTLTHKGEVHSMRLPLGDAFCNAHGPMSLESGCMTAVRKICQAIYEKTLKP